MKIFKVIAVFFGSLIILFWVIIQAFNAFINWQNSQYFQKKQQKLLEESPEERQSSKDLDKNLKEKQLEALSGFNPTNKGDIMPWDKSYMGIKGISPAIDEMGTESEGSLIFAPDISQHYQKIIQDIDDWINNPSHDLQPDDFGDNYSPFLVRNNCILYGAPGTGKTEFVRELNRALIEKYGDQVEIITDSENPNYGLQSQQSQEKKPKIPVFVINGDRIQTGGATVKDINTHEKLAKVILRLKTEFFGDPESENPYIVFIDEADQAKNTTSYKPGSCLEEWKNFLSVASESEGLSNKVNPAQDRNSIIIAATNNFDDIDPAVKRRGRLGAKLNFTWNPTTLKEYGEQQGITWPQVNGQDDPNWKFADNKEYQSIFKLTNRFGFAMLKEKFAPKTQEIIQSWQTFRSNTEPYKSKVEKELGAEEKLWCSTCGKEVERETQEARQQRIQQAIKNATQHIEDTNQKKQVEDQTREQERKKKLGKCSHDGELVCNWLLHYLHTFLLYYDKQDLNSFTKVEQIKRYEFGDNQLLRERLRELSDELYNSNIDLGNQLGTSLTKIANSLSEIKEEINAAEIQALKCQLDSLQNHLNQAQAQMGTLQGQIDSALSQLGSIRSGSSSRGGSSSSSGSNSLSQIRGTLNNITNEIQNELANLNSLINSAQGTVGNNRAAVTALNSIVYKFHDLVNKVNRLSNLVASI